MHIYSRIRFKLKRRNKNHAFRKAAVLIEPDSKWIWIWRANCSLGSQDYLLFCVFLKSNYLIGRMGIDFDPGDFTLTAVRGLVLEKYLKLAIWHVSFFCVNLVISQHICIALKLQFSDLRFARWILQAHFDPSRYLASNIMH